MDLNRIKKILGEEGSLSSKIPKFEYRWQQVLMGQAVLSSLSEGSHLIVEAGTGTGKSLAYLVPAILWAVEKNKKVVISTYTKTLQHQLLNHDIPFLQKELKIPFRYSLCMGNENYLSLRRLKRAGQAGLFTRPEEDSQLGAIFEWANSTKTGLRGNLPFEPLPSVWEDVGRQKDLCLGKNCETFNTCFYFKERRKWFGAHLLIVNHHLFFANLASQGAVLPAFDAVVFDEAQNLEEAATSFLGLEISNSSVLYFLDRLHNPRTKKGILSRFPGEFSQPIQEQVAVVRRAVDMFFTGLFEEFGQADRVFRLYKPLAITNPISVPLQELHDRLKTLESRLPSDEDGLDLSAAATRCFEFNNTLSAFLNQNLPGFVYWLEIIQKKRFTRATLRGVPVNIADELREQLFSKIDRVVLTSATLSTRGKFDFIKTRIGCDTKEEHIFEAPFDYFSQVLLYVPRDLPEPTEDFEKYVEAIARRCEKLIEVSKGRTFILFTSYMALNRVYEKLEFLKGKYNLYRQGDMPPNQMIRRFKESSSIIFGTNSFWQGVDVPGEALTSVIITKLPFDVPSDPLTEARLEALRSNSIDPFTHYQIPRAIIQLKQGFGRLIRKKNDTGIVSILDSRMVRRGYGKQFLDSLPDCRVVEDIEEIKEFLSTLPNRKTEEENLPSR